MFLSLGILKRKSLQGKIKCWFVNLRLLAALPVLAEETDVKNEEMEKWRGPSVTVENVV